MQRYALWLMRQRIAVILLVLATTAVLGYFASGMKIVIDPATLAPRQHPYIQATEKVEKLFGSKYLVVIGLTPDQGDVFQPQVLDAVQRITRRLEESPGIVKSTLLSLAAPQAKAIRGSAQGFEALPWLNPLPNTPEQIERLKADLRANPLYLDTIVSRDFKTTAILVELKERSDGFGKMLAPVRDIVQQERVPGVQVRLGGNPVYLDQTERFSQRIEWLFPIALLLIGLLHFEAFRTWQGLVLPLVTALMAVVWGTGFMGLFKQPMDIFNSPTPILILAVAAGHAVQLLKRYYEEFDLLRTSALPPREANRQAVLRSLVAVGPVMVVAGSVAALGFFSLMVFDIATIRSFGLFTGLGILSAVLLEMSFIPAVRSLLPAPQRREGQARADRLWLRWPRWVADQVVRPARRRGILLAAAALTLLCAASAPLLVIDNASKRFFADSLPLQADDAFLNTQLGGTQSLYIVVEGAAEDSLKDPAFLQGIDQLQRFAREQPHVGKVFSIVDHLKRMHQAMHADARDFDSLPASRELVSQYLLLYSLSGQPGDFDSLVSPDHRSAKITVLLKTGSNAQIKALVQRLQEKARGLQGQAWGRGVQVIFGGDVTQTIALTDTMVHGKLLNIAQIGLAVLVISSLAFRSLLAGVMVLIPLLMAVAAVFGVMGVAGIPLNIPNALISAMAVGIGADYAIYLLHRMREQARLGDPPDSAVRHALLSAGQATLFVSTAVAGGFGVLALSWGYNVHQWLALFIVLAMVVSAMAALFVLPSLVLILRPRFIFGPSGGALAPAGSTAAWAGVALLMAAALQWPAPARAQAPDAQRLMEETYRVSRSNDSAADATITLTHRDGSTRVRRTTGHTRLKPNGIDNMRLVRFLSPADISGTATLLLENHAGEDDLWVYLPALGKVRRLSSSNKKDAFVGTDFSYGDVLGHRTRDWTHRWLKEERVDGHPCDLIESLPLNDSIRQTSGYSKRWSWVRQDNRVTVQGEFWDTGGQLLKRMQASDVRAAGNQGRWQAMKTSVENLQTGHRTLIEYQQFKADQGVPATLFSPQALEH